MYLIPREDNFDAFAQALDSFLGDLTYIEPALLGMYDDLLPRIDRALGTASAARTPAR